MNKAEKHTVVISNVLWEKVARLAKESRLSKSEVIELLIEQAEGIKQKVIFKK